MADLKNIVTSLAGSEGNSDNDVLQAQDTTAQPTPEQPTHTHVDIPGAGVIGLPNSLGDKLHSVAKGIHDHFSTIGQGSPEQAQYDAQPLDPLNQSIMSSVIDHVQTKINQPLDSMTQKASSIGGKVALEGFINPPQEPGAEQPQISSDEFKKEMPRVAGAVEGVGETAGAFVGDPRNWPFLASGAARPLLKAAMSYGFAALQAHGLWNEAKDLSENWDNLSPEERSKGVTKLGLSTVMTEEATRHATHTAAEQISVSIPGLEHPILVAKDKAEAVAKAVHAVVNGTPESQRGAVGPLGDKSLNKKRMNAPVSNQTVNDILQSHKENGGATFNVKTGENQWGTGKYSVAADPSRTVVLDHEPTAEDIKSFAKENKDYDVVGTWDKGDGTHHLDVVDQKQTLKEAQEQGRKERQLAIQHMQNDSPHGNGGEIPVEYPITNSLKKIYGNRDFPAMSKTGFLAVDGTFIPIEGTMHLNAVLRAMQEAKVKIPNLNGTGLDFLTHSMNEEGFIRLRERTSPYGRELAVTIPDKVRPEQLAAIDKTVSEMAGKPRVYMERATPRPGEDKALVPDFRKIDNPKPGDVETNARELGVFNAPENSNRVSTPAEVKQFEPETKQEKIKGNNWVQVSPAEYKVQQKMNPHAASLTPANVNEMAKNKIFRLDIDGKSAGIYYYITPDGEMGGLINNGPHKGIAAKEAIKHGFENGGTYGTAWDVNGKLPDMYEKLGFKKVSSTPYDEDWYGSPSEALKQSWRKSGWKDYEDFPEIARLEKATKTESAGDRIERELKEMDEKRKTESERLDKEQEERLTKLEKLNKNIKDLSAVPEPKNGKAFTSEQVAQTVKDNDYVAKAKEQLGPKASVSDILKRAQELKVNAPEYGANNKLVTRNDYDEAKARIGEKVVSLSSKQLTASANVFSTETLKDLADMAIFHMEAGMRDFGEWSGYMANKYGSEIQPYLKDVWKAANEKLKKNAAVIGAADVLGPKGSSVPLVESPLTAHYGDVTSIAERLEQYTRQNLKPLVVGENRPTTIVNRAVSIARDELNYQLSQENSGADWYIDDVKTMNKEMQKIHPELSDPVKSSMFKAIVAASSPGADAAFGNMDTAERIYSDYKDIGGIPLAKEDGTPWGHYGNSPLRTLAAVMDKFGGDEKKATDWLTTKHSHEELNALKKTAGFKTTFKEGEHYGAYALGPKVGAFLLNLNGISTELTVDRWFSRTWNRWMGTLVSVDKAGEVQVQDTPRGETERGIMKEAVGKLEEEFGLTTSQVQAALWYYEQGLWQKHGQKGARIGGNYGDAAKEVVSVRQSSDGETGAGNGSQRTNAGTGKVSSRNGKAAQTIRPEDNEEPSFDFGFNAAREELAGSKSK